MRSIYVAVFCLLISYNGVAQHQAGAPDKPAVHGMVLFGKQSMYASHLPLFHAPHNYQILLELKLDTQGKSTFIRDQQLNPEHATYTLEPEKFILPEMIEKPRPFKANIYRGHFERGGVKIAEGVTVEIVTVLYFQQLNESLQAGEELQFILFGNAREQFAVHKISKRPDFDQIIQVAFDPALTGGKVRILTLPDHVNTAAGVSGNALQGYIEKDPVKLIFLKQLYLEFDDLK